MEISRHWRLQKYRYGLIGEICSHCGLKVFPPRDVCPECGEEAKIQYTFSGRARVYSHTTVYDAPKGLEKYVPYTIALVELEEGPIITTQLTDLDHDAVKIGMPVEMVTRKMSEDGDSGMLVYGYKFRPVLHEPVMT